VLVSPSCLDGEQANQGGSVRSPQRRLPPWEESAIWAIFLIYFHLRVCRLFYLGTTSSHRLANWECWLPKQPILTELQFTLRRDMLTKPSTSGRSFNPPRCGSSRWGHLLLWLKEAEQFRQEDEVVRKNVEAASFGFLASWIQLVLHVVDLSGPKWVGKIRLLSERRLCPVSGCFKWAMDGFTAMILIPHEIRENVVSPMSSTIPQSSPFLWFVLSPSKYGWFMARDPTRSRHRIGIAVIVDVPVLMVLGSLNLDLNFLHFFFRK